MNIHLSERSHIGKSEAAEITHVPYVLVCEDGDKNIYHHGLATALEENKRAYLVSKAHNDSRGKGQESLLSLSSMILLELT